MNILVVGNVIKDSYLNLDDRIERFETDRHGSIFLSMPVSIIFSTATLVLAVQPLLLKFSINSV